MVGEDAPASAMKNEIRDILDAIAGWECHQDDDDGPPCDAGRPDACYLTVLAEADPESFYNHCNCRCHKDFAHAVQEI